VPYHKKSTGESPLKSWVLTPHQLKKRAPPAVAAWKSRCTLVCEASFNDSTARLVVQRSKLFRPTEQATSAGGLEEGLRPGPSPPGGSAPPPPAAPLFPSPPRRVRPVWKGKSFDLLGWGLTGTTVLSLKTKSLPPNFSRSRI